MIGRAVCTQGTKACKSNPYKTKPYTVSVAGPLTLESWTIYVALELQAHTRCSLPENVLSPSLAARLCSLHLRVCPEAACTW